MLVHESYCVPMMGTIQAFRVSLWITSSGGGDLWITSGRLPVAGVCAPCRACRVEACAWIARCLLDLREKVRPAGWSGLGNAKKFALLGKNGRFSVFLGLLGEFFHGFAEMRSLLGEFFRGFAEMRPLLGEFFRAGRRMGARRANFVALWLRWAAIGRTLSRFGRGRTMQVLSCVHAGPEMRVDCSLSVGSARKSSPCGMEWIRKREKVRPAGWSGLGSAKKFALLGKNGWVSGFLGLPGEFFRGFAEMRPLLGESFRAGRRTAVAGRTFSRFGQDGGAVGRTFSRGDGWRGFAGRTFSRFSAAQRTAHRTGQASNRPATPAISR